MAVRLDKVLSELGVASRRELKQIIKAGRVSVNGQVVTGPEKHVDPDTDEICLDGAVLRVRRFRYFMMDKPAGVLSVTEDRKQQTVLDLLPPELKRLELFPVGRLDKDTEGLLILTNDGDFAHRVISPRSGVEKRYRAEVEGIPDEDDAHAFAEGLILADGTHCLPAKLEITGGSVCFVTVMEGKYHQVKRMLASRGKPVQRLRRLSVGELEIGEDLGAGGFRELEENDLCKVLKGFRTVN
ncbi:MAG: rRNA pseudouridine synthase [Oscillospiraceae bacterium]|nr:rRNA pseudouridine synthase [Oscillospiraceae bacterium]MBQ6928283.1 rRNA pseudouridine synthase [Oscillospiraceae bacterium]